MEIDVEMLNWACQCVMLEVELKNHENPGAFHLLNSTILQLLLLCPIFLTPQGFLVNLFESIRTPSLRRTSK